MKYNRFHSSIDSKVAAARELVIALSIFINPYWSCAQNDPPQQPAAYPHIVRPSQETELERLTRYSSSLSSNIDHLTNQLKKTELAVAEEQKRSFEVDVNDEVERLNKMAKLNAGLQMLSVEIRNKKVVLDDTSRRIKWLLKAPEAGADPSKRKQQEKIFRLQERVADVKRGRLQGSESKAFVQQCYEDFDLIKEGTTRAEIETMFLPAAGISGPSGASFLHPECLYFKVDVEFAVVRDAADQGRALSSPADKVIRISKPYLEAPTSD